MSNCPNPLDIRIVPFDRGISRQDFFSGQPDLDYWLRTFAGQNEARFQTRTFYALEKERTSSRLLHIYFRRSGGKCRCWGDEFLKIFKTCAVNRSFGSRHAFQNCGIGSLLVKSALTHALEASEVAGLELIIVDAIDNVAASFYSRFGFTKFDQESKRMFLTMKELRASK